MLFLRSPYIGNRLRSLSLCLMLAFSLGFLSGQLWPSVTAAGCRLEDLTQDPDTHFAGAEPARQAAATTGADSTHASQKLVCLTFDDGPSKNTPAVLEVLERYGVPATFFVIATGYNDEYLPLVRQAREAGHQIALHSASHDYSAIYSSPAAYWEDIDLLRERLSPYVDPDGLTYLRFPGGSTNTVSHKYGGSGIMQQLIREAEEKGYEWIDWNVSAEDAAGGDPDADQILANIRRDAEGRDLCVVLMHDTAKTDATVEALPAVIDWFRGQGYHFCTVEQMYEARDGG